MLLADRKVVAPCNGHGVFIIICEVYTEKNIKFIIKNQYLLAHYNSGSTRA